METVAEHVHQGSRSCARFGDVIAPHFVLASLVQLNARVARSWLVFTLKIATVEFHPT